MILFLSGMLFGWGVAALVLYLIVRRMESIRDRAHGVGE